MKVTNIAKKSLQKGFSLVEMLVVIAIIGVIAAIAVPQISNITENASEAKAKRNAQNLSSVCSAAQAAGLDFTAGAADKSAVVTAIATGGSPATGAFAGEYFGVPGMPLDPADPDRVAAETHLTLANGVLQYTPQ